MSSRTSPAGNPPKPSYLLSKYSNSLELNFFNSENLNAGSIHRAYLHTHGLAGSSSSDCSSFGLVSHVLCSVLATYYDPRYDKYHADYPADPRYDPRVQHSKHDTRSHYGDYEYGHPHSYNQQRSQYQPQYYEAHYTEDQYGEEHLPEKERHPNSQTSQYTAEGFNPEASAIYGKQGLIFIGLLYATN